MNFKNYVASFVFSIEPANEENFVVDLSFFDFEEVFFAVVSEGMYATIVVSLVKRNFNGPFLTFEMFPSRGIAYDF